MPADQWVFEVLRQHQQRKHFAIMNYLRFDSPNVWLTLEALDAAITKEGASATNFPQEWVDTMQRLCSRPGSAYSMRVESTGVVTNGSTSNKAIVEDEEEEEEEFGGEQHDLAKKNARPKTIYLRFNAAVVPDANGLASLLASRKANGDVVGLETLRTMVRDEKSLVAVKESVVPGSVYAYDVRQNNVMGRNLGARGGNPRTAAQLSAADATGGDGGDGLAAGVDGELDIATWVKQGAPIRLESQHTTPRGLTSRYDAGFPSAVMVGSTVLVAVGRQASAWPGETVRVSFTVTGGSQRTAIAVVEPHVLELTPEGRGSRAGVKITARGSGSCTIAVRVTSPAKEAADPSSAPRATVRPKLMVMPMPGYNHDMDAVLFHKESNPAIPLQDDFALPGTRLADIAGVPAPLAALSVGESWYADPSPLFVAAAAHATPTEAEIDEIRGECIRRVASSTPRNASRNDEDAVEEPSKKKTRNRFKEVSNIHMTNLGLDVTKPYVPLEERESATSQKRR